MTSNQNMRRQFLTLCWKRVPWPLKHFKDNWITENDESLPYLLVDLLCRQIHHLVLPVWTQKVSSKIEKKYFKFSWPYYVLLLLFLNFRGSFFQMIQMSQQLILLGFSTTYHSHNLLDIMHLSYLYFQVITSNFTIFGIRFGIITSFLHTKYVTLLKKNTCQ